MERFAGPNGKRVLIEALRRQHTLECSEPAIEKLARASRVRSYVAGDNLIIQDNDDNCLAFVLSGRVGIWVKGTKVAERGAGQHIGEMSVVDPGARRSATVTALQQATVAWVPEEAFSKIAEQHPFLWRGIARELAERIRQRATLLRDKNPQPVIFIGSSSESLQVARAVKKRLEIDPVVVRLWKERVFEATEVTIESLERAAQLADFAVLVVTFDDKATSRHRNYQIPRDNIVFELGLFMGAIGRNRTFMLVEDKARSRLPADLAGVTYLPFKKKNKSTIAADIDKATAEIRARVAELNVR